jgi:hypothetical protein
VLRIFIALKKSIALAEFEPATFFSRPSTLTTTPRRRPSAPLLPAWRVAGRLYLHSLLMTFPDTRKHINKQDYHWVFFLHRLLRTSGQTPNAVAVTHAFLLKHKNDVYCTHVRCLQAVCSIDKMLRYSTALVDDIVLQ